MTDRNWRIIGAQNRKDFYKKIEEYEAKGYKLHPESFNFTKSYAGTGMAYCALMSLIKV